VREINCASDTLNRRTDEDRYDGASLVRTIGYSLDTAGWLTHEALMGFLPNLAPYPPISLAVDSFPAAQHWLP